MGSDRKRDTCPNKHDSNADGECTYGPCPYSKQQAKNYNVPKSAQK